MTSDIVKENNTYDLNKVKGDVVTLIDKIINENLKYQPLSKDSDELERLLSNLSIDISNKINSPTEIDLLNEIFDQFDSFLKGSISIDGLKKIINLSQTSLNEYTAIRRRINRLVKKPITTLIEEVELELESFRRLRDISDTALTENIYSNAVAKYEKHEKKYRTYFYATVAIVLVLALLLLFFKTKVINIIKISDTEFWVLKITLLATGITLISYFLKQSSHYQKLADQNYQTQVELQAYPSFMTGIPPNEAIVIRKELALKYFGREIDGAVHKDMSNLISDQMKNTTELVKATTEAIKNIKP